jgi:hypothetical protein
MKKSFLKISAAFFTISGAVIAYNAIAEATATASSRTITAPIIQSGHLLLADADRIGACSRYKRFDGTFLNCNYTTEDECSGSATIRVEWVKDGSCSG